MRPLRPLIVALVCGVCALTARAEDVTGCGSTLAAPLYTHWATDYRKSGGGKVIYRGTGSTDGIKAIVAHAVDFAGSDAPLTSEQLSKEGLRQFPTAIGGVVPVVNLPGIKAGQLMLNGEVLSQIFLGKILYWDDPAIARLNPKIKMPNTPIAVVRRLDGSGTTLIWTHYLSQVSPEWKRKVGEGTSVHWPLGIGGKGNEGVATFVGYLPGAIGYIAWDFTKQNHLTYTAMINAAGVVVEPGIQTFSAAAANADWSSSLFQVLTNQPGKDAWPVMGATYVLLQATPDHSARNAETLKFFDWALTHGEPTTQALDYIPLPAGVVTKIRAQWHGDKSDDVTPTAVTVQ
ncbi:phosphate ABC transporter substrate-binding protein PstS [Paraburkholderia sp. CNPSo 3274]|uniref:phosphate ABC transporter substrate-binding protein PstS n=1 Tax=Paraburkholderia sp. CNPSo 3274 TaxID=2940932 RepID=UPI0020B8A3C3|nr:phosphate ABC transporter substrate-binding protein PstS [Paraburkholderia sp. CNPSo 3274]MCP3710022.1 phosphate ABC transporter substrate-binding protein PstS [Paraburkholderia sp. CNPSo 3274]